MSVPVGVALLIVSDVVVFAELLSTVSGGVNAAERIWVHFDGAPAGRNYNLSLLEAPTSRFLLLVSHRRVGTVAGGRD